MLTCTHDSSAVEQQLLQVLRDLRQMTSELRATSIPHLGRTGSFSQLYAASQDLIKTSYLSLSKHNFYYSFEQNLQRKFY